MKVLQLAGIKMARLVDKFYFIAFKLVLVSFSKLPFIIFINFISTTLNFY